MTILGLYQCPSPAGDVAASLDQIDTALGRAKEAQVDMLVMPELFCPGYKATLEAKRPEDPVDAVQRIVQSHGVGLTIGLLQWRGGALYNAAYAFDGAGSPMADYQKIQLFGPAEADAFTPGTQHQVFDLGGLRYGLLICYDIEFPEHVRALARLGAQVILCPTANMMPFINVNQVIVPARAAENAVTVVYANYCGAEGDLDYTGHSAIIGPDGYMLAGMGSREGLITAEVPGGWSEHGIPLSTQLLDYTAR